jgi:tetraacyldisaccharide-1-P 4'-kinase
MPKRWLVRPLPARKVVVMVFDPQTERQAAYALPAGAIREMADALIKQAAVLDNPATDSKAAAR